MKSFKAIRCGANKFHTKEHGDIFIHKSTKNNYEYLWTSKEKFISNLFPLDIDLYSIPNYEDSSYIVRTDGTFIYVDLVD